ncbi:hypothetical protein H072_10602 [Dactylellina haptotyla CBS 200.50]|uniref:N-acetylglucosamine-6-phosphate deacetylase n=1 Tax=Dactylellina haptotyla (strain CBS 200.50) TaxID=1284197 RepID=S8A4D0_DACHA|nr:hypothetical protein H072_10602 [Dactylellina haptotyla CBS 200.50]
MDTPTRTQSLPSDKIIRLTNCLVPVDKKLLPGTIYVNSTTGLIISPQDLFYDSKLSPSSTVDLGGRILVPGFIDVQINGAYGFDFSDTSKDGSAYATGLRNANKQLVSTGVTSYCPTITSQKNAVYQEALPYLGPSQRDASLGCSSLGAHVEGPFLNPERNGIHPVHVLQTPKDGLHSLETVYGKDNLSRNVKMITLAPELLPPSALPSLPSVLASKNIILSAGHSTATFSQLVSSNISMVTHLFNAMHQPHQREPGIPGAVLAEFSKQRYFGIIADGVHVHPANIRWAWHSNPTGLCLVTDAMALLGLPDGEYQWGNGESIIKTGGVLTLKGTTKIAGSCVTLAECLNNFMRFTGTSIAEAVGTVTTTPARMLGLEGVKGSLGVGADADLCVLEMQTDGSVVVDEVWKFGEKVWEREEGRKRRRAGVVEVSRL